MDTELFKGTLSLLILSMLSRKPMYGYELASTVHKCTEGAFTFREGSLYPSLHKMQAEGLVEGQWEEGASSDGPGRKRRYYHITDKGRALLAEKRQSWAELCLAVNRVLEDPHGQA
jgi:PadR family transcriptional regulator PadR